MPTFNFRMQMTPVELEVEATTEAEAYELVFLKFQKRMRDLGNGSVDALDERAGFDAIPLPPLDPDPYPYVRDYYCDECGPVEVMRPSGDWKKVPECTDCGKKMGPVPADLYSRW